MEGKRTSLKQNVDGNTIIHIGVMAEAQQREMEIERHEAKAIAKKKTCNPKQSYGKYGKGKKRKVDGGKEMVSKESTTLASIVGDCTKIEEEFGPN
jgi:hypothetical protein